MPHLHFPWVGDAYETRAASRGLFWLLVILADWLIRHVATNLRDAWQTHVYRRDLRRCRH